MLELYLENLNRSHRYSLFFTDGNKRIYEEYSSRQEAKQKMYDICSKYGINITRVYDDKHCKTYLSDTRAQFHINRI